MDFAPCGTYIKFNTGFACVEYKYECELFCYRYHEPRVSLGTLYNYAILAKTGISTVPDSVITGDIAVSPMAATGITGFTLILDSSGGSSTSTQVTGKIFATS
jgi:hypothetical protein